jgi:hypothetical protein
MLKVLLGIIIGIFLILLFIYSGGGDIIKRIGKDVQHIGTKSNELEKDLKKAKDNTLKAVENWREEK